MALTVPKTLVAATLLLCATTAPIFAQTSSTPPATGGQATIGGGSASSGAGGGAREACRQDAMTLCKGIQPGGGRIIQCLQGHSSELSSGCATAMSKMPARGARRGAGAGAGASGQNNPLPTAPAGAAPQ